MNVWKRLTGKKSSFSSVRRPERPPPHEAIDPKKRDIYQTNKSDKWQPSLLPGERVVCRQANIVRSNPCSCADEDETGELVVTNFKIAFCSSKENLTENNGSKVPQRNKLIGRNEIALYNIDTIYNVKKNKKKPLSPDGLNLHRTKAIEVHCKDFQIHIFRFTMLTDKQEVISVLSAITSGAFPQQSHQLFAFQYEGDASADDEARFNSAADWTDLLRRKNALGAYKVVQCNSDFRLSDSLPECFPVPSSMSDPEIMEDTKKFTNNRCPIWSYTHPTGASLIRIAYSIPGVTEDLDNKMLQHILKSQQISNGNQPVFFFDLAKKLPPLVEVQSSFAALRRLCMPASLKEFWLSDAVWHSSVESSRWLVTVSACLTTALDVVTNILHAKTVVLKEVEAVDMVPLISCLVQLILDPEVRTINGFELLIEREWVALGHKFFERYGSNHLSKESVRSAVFPLFLDCVWQLLQQYPSHFQFTEYYLVSIWDSVCLGLFRNFLFDSARGCRYSLQRLPSQEVYKSHSSSPALLSVWDWTKQFDDDQIALFCSPKYVLFHENDLTSSNSHISNDVGLEMHAKKSRPKEVTLSPKVEVSCLHLWSLSYLRWIPPAEIIGGGTACQYLSQCILVEEILYLRQLVTRFESVSAESRRSQNRCSRLIFGSDNGQSLIQSPRSLCITSSFPFALEERLTGSRSGSFIDSYFKNSVLYENDATSAADELDD